MPDVQRTPADPPAVHPPDITFLKDGVFEKPVQKK